MLDELIPHEALASVVFLVVAQYISSSHTPVPKKHSLIQRVLTHGTGYGDSA